MPSSPHVRRNRAAWDGWSAWYQREHGPQLNTRPLAWGVWALPEDEVGALGEVAGSDVLELGCGGGQWSGFLAEAGARPVGIDLSGAQLRSARVAAAGRHPLVHGDAEQLPFRSGSFDLVMCDHGAMSWADPDRTVPEVSRVLRPGGRLVFNAPTPWFVVAHPGGDEMPSERLVNPYFGLHQVDEEDGSCSFVLGYGDWIRLFRRSNLEILEYIELRPPEGGSTTYEYVTVKWARRWPAEAIWVVGRT